MEKGSKVYVAGHQGLVGSAIVRALQERDYTNLVYRSRKQLDLTDFLKTAEFFQAEKPEYVFIAAAKVSLS